MPIFKKNYSLKRLRKCPKFLLYFLTKIQLFPLSADWDVDHMDLQWAKPMSNGGSPITKYEVERRCETTKQDWEIVFECNQNTYTHTDTKGIVYKHKYQYRVCCYNKAGKSPYGGPTPLVAARKRKRKYKIKKYFEVLFKFLAI